MFYCAYYDHNTHIPSVQVPSKLHCSCSSMARVEFVVELRSCLFIPCTSSGTRPVGGDLQTSTDQIGTTTSVSDHINVVDSMSQETS